jgi:phosphoglycerate dehydrogenase-like enzyme
VKVVIVGRFPDGAKGRIAGAFPGAWTVVLASPEDVAAELADADVLIPEHLLVDGALLDGATRLRLVQTGAGSDNVDIAECARRGVRVAHARGVNAGAVAEHVFALILGWFKNVIWLDQAMKRGAYDVEYAGAELSGKTLGIVGLGNIGREVGRLGRAFRLQLFGCHRRQDTVAPEVELVDLPTLLQRSDIVSLHVSLHPETQHLIGRKELALMRRDALLVNTSRGGVVDEEALVEALEREQIGGAALDVFETEPLSRESPLRKMRNVILTPHMAGMPDGLRFHGKRYAFFVENIRRVSEGLPPLNLLTPMPRGGAASSCGSEL